METFGISRVLFVKFLFHRWSWPVEMWTIRTSMANWVAVEATWPCAGMMELNGCERICKDPAFWSCWHWLTWRQKPAQQPRLSNQGSATTAQKLRLRNYATATKLPASATSLQQPVKSRYVLLILNPPPLSPCYTHFKSRCVVLILDPPPFRLATHMSSLDVYFLFEIHPPFALLHTCQVSMCTSYFKSTPLSPCYTHVKSRCVLLIWNPPPFRLATHMSSLDMYFLFYIIPPFALLRTCQVSICTSYFKSTPFRLATHISSLDVQFLF